MDSLTSIIYLGVYLKTRVFRKWLRFFFSERVMGNNSMFWYKIKIRFIQQKWFIFLNQKSFWEINFPETPLQCFFSFRNVNVTVRDFENVLDRPTALTVHLSGASNVPHRYWQFLSIFGHKKVLKMLMERSEMVIQKFVQTVRDGELQ